MEFSLEFIVEFSLELIAELMLEFDVELFILLVGFGNVYIEFRDVITPSMMTSKNIKIAKAITYFHERLFSCD